VILSLYKRKEYRNGEFGKTESWKTFDGVGLVDLNSNCCLVGGPPFVE
jgi:hypothetical protein